MESPRRWLCAQVVLAVTTSLSACDESPTRPPPAERTSNAAHSRVTQADPGADLDLVWSQLPGSLLGERRLLSGIAERQAAGPSGSERYTLQDVFFPDPRATHPATARLEARIPVLPAARGVPPNTLGPGPEGLPAFGHGQHADARGESYRGQAPVPLERFGLIYWNPSVPLSLVRAAAPHAINLAYFDCLWVAWQWGTDEEMWGRQRNLFHADELYWLDDNGNRVGVAPGTWELRYTDQIAIANARFAAQELQDWDGIFLDEFAGALSPDRLRALPISEAEWPALQQQWERYRDLFYVMLRAHLPEGKFLTANSGSHHLERLRHLDLDGIASEEWWPDRQAEFLEECQRYRRGLCQSIEFRATDAFDYEDSENFRAWPRYSILRTRSRYQNVQDWGPWIP